MYNSPHARRLRDGDAARSCATVSARIVRPTTWALPDEPRCELPLRQVPGDAGADTAAPTSGGETPSAVLADYADRSGGQAFVSPVDVTMADHSIVQPDVGLCH